MRDTEKGIQRMDTEVSDRIKAQTSIESYEAAIKKLVLNSIEAGSSEITVKAYKPSLSVTIEDNGEGMGQEDLENVGMRSYTSKNRAAATKGEHIGKKWHGETLHSMAMVSLMKIVSKVAGQKSAYILKDIAGYRGISKYSSESSETECFADGVDTSCLQVSGTVIIATNIFYNIPVRRKMELGRPTRSLVEGLRSFLLLVSVPYPNVKIDINVIESQEELATSLSNRGRITVNDRLSRARQLAFLMRSVYGNSMIAGYKVVETGDYNHRVNGFIAESQSTSKRHQYVFVNGEAFNLPSEDAKRLSRISTTEPKRQKGTSPSKRMRRLNPRYPVFLLEVEKRNETVDMSGMKDKQLSQFDHWNEVKYMVFAALEDFFGIGLSNERSKLLKRAESVMPSGSDKTLCFPEEMLNRAGSIKSTERHILSSPTRESKTDETLTNKHLNDVNKTHEWKEISRNMLLNSKYRVIRQIDKKFILLSISAGISPTDPPMLLIIDQHACDERIRVEDALRSFVHQILNPDLDMRTPLSNPLLIHTTEEDHDRYTRHKPNFKLFGIQYSILENGILLSHVPDLLVDYVERDPDFIKSGLLRHLDDLDSNCKKSELTIEGDSWFFLTYHLPFLITEVINRAACRGAIMFGDTLNRSEMEQSIRWLAQCNLPFQCAHGRPSAVPLF